MGEYGWGDVSLVKSYDSSTGVLTAYIYLRVQTRNHANANWHGPVLTKQIPVNVYLVK